MKKYRVSTQSAVNAMNLHHSHESEFISESLSDAECVFDEEVEQLKKEYQSLYYKSDNPSDSEMSHAIFCEIIELDTENEDYFESIKVSEEFYGL